MTHACMKQIVEHGKFTFAKNRIKLDAEVSSFDCQPSSIDFGTFDLELWEFHFYKKITSNLIVILKCPANY